MSLRIRQIVVAARDLSATVAQFESVLGLEVCYRDPEVAKFGLANALFLIGDQFLEIVSPIQENTAAGRHLDRHGDSGYMLILQSDDLDRDRQRFKRLGVRIVWEATHADISAVHLHPKDIGAAIVSIDQPVPPASWRWAGPGWQRFATKSGAQQIIGASIATQDIQAMSRRWAQVLGTAAPTSSNGAAKIDIESGALNFIAGNADVLAGFAINHSQPTLALTAAREQSLKVTDSTVTICGTEFKLLESTAA